MRNKEKYEKKKDYRNEIETETKTQEKRLQAKIQSCKILARRIFNRTFLSN